MAILYIGRYNWMPNNRPVLPSTSATMLSVHRGIFAVLVFSSLPVAISGKCLVGQRCFPSASELAAFNTSIGGRLFAERPIGAVCYAKDKDFNEEECYNELPNFFDDLWISDHFPAYVGTRS